MNYYIVTLFPEAFDSYIKESILGKAVKNKIIKVKFYNPRDFVSGKYKKVWADGNVSSQIDGRPYGGGPGMVMRAEPILKAVVKVLSLIEDKKKKVLIINFIPSKEKFTTKLAKNFAKNYTDIILICGRYEGIDARVDKILSAKRRSIFNEKKFVFKRISIGDYIVTGGELPALILIDSISRQVDGVLGKNESREEERISSSEVYTRPEILKYSLNKHKNKKHKSCPAGNTFSLKVPKVLLSGNHKLIENWKQSKKKS